MLVGGRERKSCCMLGRWEWEWRDDDNVIIIVDDC